MTNIGEKVTHPFNQAISNQTENSESLVTKCIYPWEHHCKLCIRKLSQASLWKVRRRRSESKFGKSRIHNNELEQTFTFGLLWEFSLRSSVSSCCCCLFFFGNIQKQLYVLKLRSFQAWSVEGDRQRRGSIQILIWGYSVCVGLSHITNHVNHGLSHVSHCNPFYPRNF